MLGNSSSSINGPTAGKEAMLTLDERQRIEHAQVVWGTQGEQTMGRFAVPLPPGTYFLVLSNQFSILTDKTVMIEATLDYQQRKPGESSARQR